ncbi:hypothetical protein CFP56_005902 [Quercus suber]|uniref:Uncharacterized protein n=1 Tax=Quercus suber TaxID=58331 RepID=A0AAW0M806_QUESU
MDIQVGESSTSIATTKHHVAKHHPFQPFPLSYDARQQSASSASSKAPISKNAYSIVYCIPTSPTQAPPNKWTITQVDSNPTEEHA